MNRQYPNTVPRVAKLIRKVSTALIVVVDMNCDAGCCAVASGSSCGACNICNTGGGCGLAKGCGADCDVGCCAVASGPSCGACNIEGNTCGACGLAEGCGADYDAGSSCGACIEAVALLN